MKNKHAQIWSLDLMSGMALFLVGILLFYIYTLNQSGEAQDSFELLFYDGNIIANSLMSPGYPEKWNSTNVVTLGITDNNKINETKLLYLYNMINIGNNYNKTKNLFNTKYDYYFFFEDNMTSIASNIEGIGKPDTTKDNVDAKNLVKITRFTVYQNKTTPLYIYIWEE